MLGAFWDQAEKGKEDPHNPIGVWGKKSPTPSIKSERGRKAPFAKKKKTTSQEGGARPDVKRACDLHFRKARLMCLKALKGESKHFSRMGDSLEKKIQNCQGEGSHITIGDSM